MRRPRLGRPLGAREGLPVRRVLPTGPFVGTWRRYATRAAANRIGAVIGTCRRCRTTTWDARAAGWYYSHGQAGQLRRQLCQGCVAVLWGAGSPP